MARKAAKDRQNGSELGADGTKSLVNADARRDIINNTIREVRAIDGRVKTLQAERREIINTRIKGDLDMKVADFAAVLRLTGLEDENRAKFLDTLRETFVAVGLGGQLNFLDAIETNAKAPASKEDAGFTFAAGREAGLEGKNANTNPHIKGSEPQKKWHEGWLKGQSEIAHQTKAKTGNGAGAAAH